MATGDSNDIRARLRSLIPGGWFGNKAPLRDAILGGLSDGLSNAFGLLAAVRLQTRIATASGWFLDLVAWDFFGSRFLRHQGETDGPWRNRIIAEILRERGTRKGITEALVNLTGIAPQIFEPANPGDCGGGYGIGGIAYGGAILAQPVGGYGSPLGGYGGIGGEMAFIIPSTYRSNAQAGAFAGSGCWGSLSYPFQVFVTAYRPSTAGIPFLSGYGCYGGGYGFGTIAYADIEQVIGAVTDADIYDAVSSSAAAGVIAWTAIENAPPVKVPVAPPHTPIGTDDQFLLLAA